MNCGSQEGGRTPAQGIAAERELAASLALARLPDGRAQGVPGHLGIEDQIAARGAWLRVDLTALRANLDLARSLIPAPAKLMAVVKADAYGHGMIAVAQTAIGWGCEWLGVGNLLEGIELRRSGITEPCLVLAPLLPAEAPAYVEYGLTPSIVDLAGASALSEAADRPVELHLLVDEGLGRFGVAPGEAAQLGKQVSELPHLRIGGIYTHFADPADEPRTRSELRRFLAAKDELERMLGERVPLVHAAGSEAAVILAETQLDLVRLGNLMYGYWAGPAGKLPRGPGGQGPMAVLELRARIIAVRDVARGDRLGYGDFRARRGMRVAVLPVGAADAVGLRSIQTGAGLLPALLAAAKEVVRSVTRRWRLHALVGGRRAPVVGRIGMQFTLVDVSGIDDAQVGAEAIVPGIRATAARGLPRAYEI